MARGHYRYLTLIVLAAVLAFLLYPSEKKRVHKVLTACRESVSDEDPGQLMELISYNYRDDYGGSYLVLKKRAEMAFSRYDDFDVTADVMKIAIDGEQAEAHIKVSIIATDNGMRGYVIGNAERAADIRVYLEKSPYEWKVVKIDFINDGALSHLPFSKGG